MDYFVILVTLSTLFFGLLFYVDKWPTTDLKYFAEWLAFFMLVISTIIVILMILWDINSRRNHDRRRKKQQLRDLIEVKANDEKVVAVINALYDREKDDVYMGFEMPWDKDFDFKPVSFKSESSSSGEDNSLTMNDIFADIFSYRRLKRRVDKFKKSGLKKSIMKVFKK
jgi:amino acid transporter